MDTISKRYPRVDHLLVFILDEADEMLSRGFRDEMCDTFKTLNLASALRFALTSCSERGGLKDARDVASIQGSWPPIGFHWIDASRKGSRLRQGRQTDR